jgi:hypothetical protein
MWRTGMAMLWVEAIEGSVARGQNEEAIAIARHKRTARCALSICKKMKTMIVRPTARLWRFSVPCFNSVAI